MILEMLCDEAMRIETLLQVIQAQTVRGPRQADVRAVVCDSRQVRPGALFVALPGRRTDGLRYVDEAVARGAVAVVTEAPAVTPRDVAHIRVEDARRALAEIACAFHGNPSRDLAVVGITGTNGKTTVGYLARNLLEAAGLAPGLVGTVAYEVGRRVIPAARTTPEAPELQDLLAQIVRAGGRAAVMEVSSHALAQQRVWGIDFDVAVFTNLTGDHLDYHGTMERYFEAKALLFQGLGRMEKPGVAVVNLDDPWGRRLLETPGAWARTWTYGEHPAADVRALDVELGPAGTRFRLVTPAGDALIRSPLLGRFNVSNALAAAAAALALEVPLDLCARGIERFVSAPGRLEPVPNAAGLRVFVDYAHTDDALGNVLATLRELSPGGRLLVVFGCGGDRDRAKRPRMGAVAGRWADLSILTSDNPRSEDPAQIIAEIAAGFPAGAAVERIAQREEAIAAALDRARPEDVVLIAGKGHERTQEFARTVVPFDDREVVRRHLGERAAP